MQKEVEEVYNIIQAEVPAETRGEFTLDEYKQAWAFADRHFLSIQKDDYTTNALVPFLNYLAFQSETKVGMQFDAEKKGLQIIANKKIARGEEISLAAGSDSNDWFLCKQGEVRVNKPTRIRLEEALRDADPMSQEKLKLLGARGAVCTFSLYPNVNDHQFGAYVMFLRFRAMNGSPEVFAKMNFFNENGDFLGTPIASQGTKSEQMIWQTIANNCLTRMQAYPVPLPEVQKILADASTPEGPLLTLASKVAHQYLMTE